ncbi:MAG: DUF262 domain-containing protein [Synergistaceae bacterium]|nr:DUF262 domain-containing protein [Synergistaceae bacterium]
MPGLEATQKTIKQLLGDSKADFLVPEYQRQYAWEKKECQTLWDDLLEFAFPQGENFNSKTSEYFLGSIVTFHNDNDQHEIIDGQQRLTTLMLLLRAIYTRYGTHDSQAAPLSKDIESCIWKADELGNVDKNSCKLETLVATDELKEEFKEILRTGEAPDDKKSLYAENYRFFLKQIDDFLQKNAGSFAYLPARILNNCILLTVDSYSSESAMRIFSTLNDRGRPLSDSDIFKAQLYKYYDSLGRKEEFLEKWKDLEDLSARVYTPLYGTPMDEAFTRYMYYERAKLSIRGAQMEALLKFYARNSYALLKNEKTFENIIDLAKFWHSVVRQDSEIFSERILRRLFVLKYAPNETWTNIVSVYYLANRDSEGKLDEEKFFAFLNKITAFIWGYTFITPGVNALKGPISDYMINIVKGVEAGFDRYKFDSAILETAINNYSFTNMRPITKSMLAWWALNYSGQASLDINKPFQIEHIYAKKRQEFEKGLSNPKNLESLGNKSLLEDGINIRASDYHFADKIKYYTGQAGKKKQPTQIQELLDLSKTHTDFGESDIVQRKALMIQKFLEYLKNNDLIK